MSVTEAGTSPSLKQLALGDLNHELGTTRKLLERVPEAHLDWKPHEKSMTLGGLALHVATIPFWARRVLEADFFDLMTATRNPPPTTLQEILDAFEERTGGMRQALDAADDASLTQPWQLRRGEQVLQTMPRLAVIRTMCINHMIHHRAQLSVYLRQLDVPLPPMYGPTADEQPAW
ncbi:MAG TPA: DinB family protein [Longimicrobium sp.]|nr:DinB family protein [Longimicrobium sp.]